jgi:hypothetical protein
MLSCVVAREPSKRATVNGVVGVSADPYGGSVVSNGFGNTAKMPLSPIAVHWNRDVLMTFFIDEYF